MTDSEQITLYSCHICGFCETSLPALTKHTASHIKSEYPIDPLTSSNALKSGVISSRNWPHFSRVSESRRGDDGCASVEADGPEIALLDTQSRDENRWNGMNGRSDSNTGNHTSDGNAHIARNSSQLQDGFSNSNRGRTQIEEDDDDDDVIVVEESLRSPQIADVFPASSYPVTTQSRVIFPSGWNETPQRTTTIRMPNDQYRNIHQTSSASAQESNEQSSRLPKIINCTTVRPSSVQSDFSRDSFRSSVRSENSGRSAAPEDNFVQYYQDDSHEERMFIDSRPANRSGQSFGRFRSNSSYGSSSSSHVTQNTFNKPSRLNEPQISHNDVGHQRHSYPRVRPISNHEDTNRLTSRNSAFSSFNNNIHESNYHNSNSQYPQDFQHPSHSRNYRPIYQNGPANSFQNRPQHSNQTSSPETVSISNNSSRITCPMPLPNNAHFIPYQNQPIVLPAWNQDNLSGFIVVPIKKTSEIAIQTDESCLSVDYVPYQSSADRGASNSIHAFGEKNAAKSNSEMNFNDNVNHANSVSGTSSVKCQVCNKEFLNQSRMQAHFDKFHSLDKLKCRDCGRAFQSAKNMQMHRARVHNKRMPFRCGVCGLRFEDRSSVVQHLATHNVKDKVVSCELCGKKFRSEEKLKKHLLKHKDMWHKCAECDKSFGSVATLRYHTTQVHKRKQQSGDTFNNADFITVSSNAAQTYADVRKPTVDRNEGFGEDNSMTNAEGHGELFSCQYCHTDFNDLAELNRHVTECSLSVGKRSTKMFRCAACPTFFATKSELINHYNANHLTRDGYVCSKCPRKFRLWSKLKIHIKSFHGLKKTTLLKFPCKVCSSKFSSRLKLDDHMKKVHQIPVKHERIYTCKECKKRFKNLSSLMVHRRGVHALNILESPSTQTWECPHCNIDRLTRKTYIAHLKEVHKLLVAEKGRSLEIIGKDDSGAGQVKESGFDSLAGLEDGIVAEESANSSLGAAADKIYCQECGADFIEEKRLKNHLGLVHGKKPFSCEICNRKFSYSGQVVWHMRDHGRKDAKLKQLNGNASGPSCDITTNNELFGQASGPLEAGESSSKVAKSSRHHSEMFPCTHCELTFPEKKRLNNHLGVRHGYKNFSCDICNQKFSYSTHLIWHKRSHFSDKKKESGTGTAERDDAINQQVRPEDEASVVEQLNCVFCEEMFADEEALRVHIKTHENETTDPTEKESDNSNEQSSGVDGKLENTVSGEKSDANRDESTPVSTDGHIESHKQRSRYICGQCEAEFSDQDLFRDHMIKSHDAAIDMPNNDASKADMHQPGHESRTTTKGFTCEVCHKQLGTYIGWKVHRTRVHRLSDNKHATQAAAVTGGVLGHSESFDGNQAPQEKNERELGSEDLSTSAVFSCSKCSRIFTGLRNLRAHQFKMHSIRMKERSTRGSISASESQPTEKPLFAKVQDCEIFQCGTCDYRFSSEKGRRIHCKKMMHAEHGIFSDPAGENMKASRVQDSSDVSHITADDESNVYSPTSKKAKFDEDTDAVISPCEICDIQFDNFQKLRKHFQEKHPEEFGFESPIKEFGHQSTFELREGGKFLSKSAPSALRSLMLDCPKCERSFPTRKGLNTHLVKCHKIKGAAFLKWKSQGVAPSMSENTDEQHAAHNNAGFIVDDIAQETKSRKTSLSKHFMPTMVGDLSGELDQSEVPRRVCSICQRSFHNRRGLTMHMARFHHLNKAELRKFNIDLDLIGQSEMNADAVDVEKAAKPLEKPAHFQEICPLCSLRFPSRRSLGTHIFKRHGIRCKRLSPAERRSLFSMNKQTSSETGQISALKESLVAIDCPICSGKFVGKRGVRAHVSRIHSLDKIELGFLFPEKYQTEDTTSKTCTHCERHFSNIRIYAAHLYFVHKIDQDESIANEDATELVYRCSDLKCEAAFKSSLELLIHVRAKNGRSIHDIDVVMINNQPLHEKQIEDDIEDLAEFDDFDDFDDDDDDHEVEIDPAILVDDGVDEDMYGENEEVDVEELHNASPADFLQANLACFLCKSDFEDERSFRVHYEKAHGRMSADDAEKLRDLIERNRLQTDAVSKEYSLRATASRNAFRSEIELTEHCLRSPTSEGDGDEAEAGYSDRGLYAEEESSQIDAPMQLNKETANGDPTQSDITRRNEIVSDNTKWSESQQMNENHEETGQPEQPENGPSDHIDTSKKTFFAAALNLQVTP